MLQNNKDVKACKIVGDYDDYVVMMGNKLNSKNKIDITNANNCTNLLDCNSDIIIIDSFDGAQHRRTSKERTNIVSFSSQMLTLNSIKAGYSTSASRNILTWQQMIGTESYANLMPVLEPIYERKK